MLKIERLIKPRDLREAGDLYRQKSSTLLAGGTLSRLYDASYDHAVDIAHLLDDRITEEKLTVRIGAMTTLRAIERSEILRDSFGTVLRDSVAHLGGVQLRNMITAGGTVAAHLGTSEFLTVLLVLDASVEVYGQGMIDLQTYLQGGYGKEIIVSLQIPRVRVCCSLQSVRNSYTDASMLHAACCRSDDAWRIAVGARPMRGRICSAASLMLEQERSPEIDSVVAAAVEELTFASDLRVSAEYRRDVCPVLIRRALLEVLS